MKLEAFIAFRYLTRRKKAGFVSLISLISVLGVTVGVMALIVVLAVMSGFDRELKKKIVGIQPHIMIQEQGGLQNFDAIADRVRALGIPEILSVSPFVTGQAIIRAGTQAMGVVVKGLDSGEQAEFASLGDFMKGGKLQFQLEGVSVTEQERDAPQGGLVIGTLLAAQLGVKVGDEVQLISPVLEKKGLFRASAKTESFLINGLYHFGMHDVDASLVLMDLAQARTLYQLGDHVTGLSLKLTDVEHAGEIQDILYNELGYRYWIQTWMDANRTFFSALQVEKKVMSILLFLIILVAAFNVVSTLIMVVMEKTRDIAILKALGAGKSTIRSIFILEGTLVGIFGTSLGVASGLWIASRLNVIAEVVRQTTGFELFPSDIYFFDVIPTEINMSDVVSVALFAFVTTMLAGWYPAHRAASLNPVEGLRYE